MKVQIGLSAILEKYIPEDVLDMISEAVRDAQNEMQANEDFDDLASREYFDKARFKAKCKIPDENLAKNVWAFTDEEWIVVRDFAFNREKCNENW